MLAAIRDRQQVLQRSARLGQARLGRPAPAHADDHRVVQQRGPVPGDGGLPVRLPVPMTASLGPSNGTGS